jgi:hypothetical protein
MSVGAGTTVPYQGPAALRPILLLKLQMSVGAEMTVLYPVPAALRPILLLRLQMQFRNQPGTVDNDVPRTTSSQRFAETQPGQQ